MTKCIWLNFIGLFVLFNVVVFLISCTKANSKAHRIKCVNNLSNVYKPACPLHRTMASGCLGNYTPWECAIILDWVHLTMNMADRETRASMK
jgi:hypothetical protein